MGYMIWRRISLLLVGIAGGLLAIVTLCVMASEFRYIHAPDLPLENHQLFCQKSINQINMPSTANFCMPEIIQGTTLLAERLTIYEGPFLEDGSDREVADVAALMVRNVGNSEIERCSIELYFDEVCYTFYGERIPPNATVLLLECEGMLYRTDSITSCNGWQVIASNKQDLSDFLKIEERAMGTIVVTNTTNIILNDICIYYKTWLSPPDIYVGGIAYSVEITKLMPGQSEYLYPYHFAYGYSKVVSLTAK